MPINFFALCLCALVVKKGVKFIALPAPQFLGNSLKFWRTALPLEILLALGKQED